MPKPFPVYEKELKEFIEITHEIARRDFNHLCNLKHESGQECGDRLMKLKPKEEPLKDKKEEPPKPKTTFDEWFDSLEQEEPLETETEEVITYD